MPLFIALAITAGAASVLLIYQFLQHTLEDAAPGAAPQAPAEPGRDDALKAA